MQHTTLPRRALVVVGATVMCVTAQSGCANDNGDDAAVAANSAIPSSVASTDQPAREPSPPTSDVLARTTTTHAPPSTDVVDPLSDADIATRLLLEASEYAPGWMIVDFKDIVLDRFRADDVPGCAVFLDTVFESPDRRAVTSYRSFLDASVPVVMNQYVVVFPSADEAQAMFEATVDPTFHDQCFQPYFDLAGPADGEWCCDTEETGMPALWGQPVESDAELGADEIAFRVDDEQFWTDDTGVEHGPESVRSVTVRVGRAVMIMETLSLDEHGNQVVTDEQFDSAVAAAVERARTALDEPAD